MDLNSLNLTGNLTADPEAPRPAGQTTVVSFRLASSGFGDPMYIDCAVFGKAGEKVTEYCKKGMKVGVTGRLKYEMWDDKNNPGQKRFKHSMVVNEISFLSKKESSDSDESKKPEGKPF